MEHQFLGRPSGKLNGTSENGFSSFRLAPGTARLQASPVSKKVGGLTSWSIQLDSPGTALTVGGWIRLWGQN